STRAYQGSVPGLDQAFLSEVEAATTSGVRPDLTLILDVPSDVCIKRLSQRRSAEAADRFEKDGDEIFKARRQAFLDIAAREPDRCVVIAASGSVDEIGARIEGIVLDRFGDEIARLRRIGLESAR
uniref:dTMP kinase n=1 Tax=uncultured Aureimonas sp. TaxID=1604662 RepID=UPI00345C42D1